MKEEKIQDLSQVMSRIDRIVSDAQTVYTQKVEALIQEKCVDPERIEHLLDGLLDFCFDPEMLRLYKRLCRYYYDIAPMAAVDYVGFYRELWDSDDDDS